MFIQFKFLIEVFLIFVGTIASTLSKGFNYYQNIFNHEKSCFYRISFFLA